MNDISESSDLSAPARPARSSRARLVDIARESGVSTATVDRVLNQRSGVRQKTVQRVLQVALEMDYLPDDTRFAAAQAKPMRLEFILPDSRNRFIRMLGDYVEIVERNFAPFNISCHCRFVEALDPESLARNLLKYGERADGVAFIALEHPAVREAANTLAERGRHVVTLVSDLSNSRRSAYVGLDNDAAGRTAGFLMGRLLGERRGKVALIAGSLNYRGHHEREMGFQQVQLETFPQLEVIGVREGRDDSERTHEIAHSLLLKHHDLIGIYNIGGGVEGIARALKEVQRETKVAFVGHEILPETRGYLIDGTMDVVINQNPHKEVMNAIRIFTNLRDRKPAL
ncbi:MAG: LacI family DNA-binding transcriptional regulator, partial [Propionivibrio sp.]